MKRTWTRTGAGLCMAAALGISAPAAALPGPAAISGPGAKTDIPVDARVDATNPWVTPWLAVQPSAKSALRPTMAAEPAPLADRAAMAAAMQAAQRELPAATAMEPAVETGGDDLIRARRGAQLPETIEHGVAVDSSDSELRSRRAVYVRPYKVAEGETVRSIAYKFCTSPKALAALNAVRWTDEGVTLTAGETVEVPIRFRSANAFSRGARLASGAGVRVDRPHHAWGRPYVISMLRDAFAALDRTFPGRHPLIIHDISRFGGGKLGGHKSHRAGLDIDIGYPTREANREGWGQPALASIDYERLWFVVERLERTGQVAAIYMSPGIQRRLHAHAVMQGADPKLLQVLFQYPAAHGAKTTLIRHAKGHRDHLHIRFASPEDLPEFTS